MIIGVDLDGVILDSEMGYRVEAELYDKNVLKKNSLIDEKELAIFKRYDWNESEKKQFLPILKETARNSHVMPGAKKVIDLLKASGDKLILVSARGSDDQEMQEIGMNSLKISGIFLDKYYFGVKDKAEVCKNENIDVMIDDSYRNCEKISSANIFTLYFADVGMREMEENEYLKPVYNWGEIYSIIEQKKKEHR
ncbi:MAG: hypothetical protein Q4D02_06595 [Clostridia bacterium]|nr:hypothetical protein [Clostridia bacterium]